MDQRIVDAIRDRLCLKLRYYGKYRVVEPHAYGLDRMGDELLLCYEPRDGGGGSWERLRLFEALSVAVLPTVFSGPRPGYRQDDAAFDRLYAQL